MKRTILTLTIIAALATSCSKTTTTNNNNNSGYGTFTYMGTTYTAVTGAEGTGFNNGSYDIIGTANIPAGGTGNPSISVNFKRKPTSSGNYDVVDGTGTPGNNDCFVIYTASSGKRYLSNNASGKTVAVTVSGNTISAAGTDITLEEDNHSSNSGPATFNFHD